MVIESFNGRLRPRDKCLNRHAFTSVAEAQEILNAWCEDYNFVRPHSSLQDRTPAVVGVMWVDSREPRESTAISKGAITGSGVRHCGRAARGDGLTGITQTDS